MGEKRVRRNWFAVLGVFVAVFVFAFLAQELGGDEVEAANFGAFDPGYIISDYQMTNYTSMSEADIQNFLKSKEDCNDRNIYRTDLAGVTVGYFSESLPYTWHVKDGHFVCLADENINGESAAHIIWQAAQDYHINPKVLIATLQKEQWIVTDSFPNSVQYKSAMGYACPDTAECDPKYAGFKNQVREAAGLFRDVMDGGWTTYPVGNTYVQYSPDSSCGGSYVNIRNRATSALYRYTPYQPNTAALSVPMGQTVHCGAYGNKNFYGIFEDWFGGATLTPDEDKKLIVDGVYYIGYKGDTDKVVNILGTGTEAGTNLEIWDKKESLHQTWRLMSDGDYYRVQDTYSGLFVDLYGASTKDGTNIQLWLRNDTCSQKWKIRQTEDGYYKFISACGSESALDLYGGYSDNGTNIQLWSGNNTDAQKWNLVPAATIAEGSYVLVAKKNGGKAALDVYGALKANGTNVQLWGQHRGGAQIWNISYNPETNDYVLVNPNSGKALDVAGASDSDGANVQVWERNDSCAQRWKIIQTSDNHYSLVSACSSDKMLDMYGAGTSDGTNIQLWHNNSGDAQKWDIIPASVVANGVYSVEASLDKNESLDVYGASTDNGANVQLWAGTQKWRIVYDYDTGYYSVTNFGKALDAYGAYTQSGVNIQLWGQNQTCAQRWRILRTLDGYYTFMNGCSQSYVLDVYGTSASDGANIQLWRSSGEATQKWFLQR